jgi:hypothetical protein
MLSTYQRRCNFKMLIFMQILRLKLFANQFQNLDLFQDYDLPISTPSNFIPGLKMTCHILQFCNTKFDSIYPLYILILQE